MLIGAAEALADRFDVVVPDLPFGAHKVPMAPDVVLDAGGLATIVDDFTAALGLGGVTLVGNDSGGECERRCSSRAAPFPLSPRAGRATTWSPTEPAPHCRTGR
jgi:pimeloyl-ACP methyl ester carboxylesterase